MAKMKEIVIRRTERLVGVTAAAKRLGCTQANVSMVVRGVRKSRSLLERMRKMNIRVEA
jgi:predicted transcriptional regulator